MKLRPMIGFTAALLTACTAMYPFDYYVLREGPIFIGTDWTELRCPEVIESARADKELWLLLPQALDVPDYRDEVAVHRRTGERVAIFAEAVDSKGKTYPMGVWTQRGSIAGRPREGTYLRLLSNELPRTLRLSAVRLRSSQPVELSEVLWIDARTPGPPVRSLPTR